MEENFNGQNQPKTYGDESNMYQNQQGDNQQPNYNQQPNFNQQPYGAYGAQQPQHGPVKDVFCYLLLVIMPLRIILSWISSNSMLKSMSYDNIMDGSYVNAATSGIHSMLSVFSNLLFIAFIVFVILDIVMISKQNYKITGLILFAIFLNPGYYIWRAHVLGRKKTFPIIYTVLYAVLMVAYWISIFYSSFQMAFSAISPM